MADLLVWTCMKDGPTFLSPDSVVELMVSCERAQGHEGRHRWSADDGEMRVQWTDDWPWAGLTYGAWRDEGDE